MGQGYSVVNPAANTVSLDLPELADFDFEKVLTGPRFLKTIRARHKDGLVILKIYTKPFSNVKLDDRVRQLIDERRQLVDVPNALPYHRILETNTNALLIRQYVHSSLYDRISTNPPLEDIERKWIAFQLLCAVRDCHARNIYHGDIKTENMLITSWGWLYLTDFAANIKPRFLPEDNPVNFTLFYDTTVRRICYIAPERFTSSSQIGQHDLQWAMDIFSVGCVIAELFTEKPTFTLSQLFRYRKGEFDPAHTSLASIKDGHVREMVIHMINLKPDDRYSAQEYLDFWQDKAFPSYFYTFLHQYTHVLTDPTSGQKPVTVSTTNSGGSDDRIDRIYNDYDKIAYALNLDGRETSTGPEAKPLSVNLNLFPLQVDVPGNRHLACDRTTSESDNGALLFSNIVVTSLRSTARATSRIRGCELLLTFGQHLTDEAKLDRILPYAMALLDDEVPMVRNAAILTITQLLSLVKALSPMNAFVFARYLIPLLSKFVSSTVFMENAPLRATYAACVSDLALTATRFLDMTQALRADGSLPSIDPEAEDDAAAYTAYQLSYDTTRAQMVREFEGHTKRLLTDTEPSVRRALLGSVGGLCVFFGDSLASDLLLTHLNTYLNDEDWTLRCALCEAIVGVAVFVGSASLEDFILPLLVQALTDPEEFVTEQVLRSLASMASMGLLQRWIALELLLTVTRFTLHPNQWIREAAAQYIASVAMHFSYPEFRSLIEPLLRPVLKIDVPDAEENTILDALKKAFPRAALDLAKNWAGRADKGTFWHQAQHTKSFAFDTNDNRAIIDIYRGNSSKSSTKTTKDAEDEQWMTRLRNAGMRSDDETKLIALRDYVWKSVLRAGKAHPDSSVSRFNNIVSLTALRVPLQNVLFEEDSRYYDQIANRDLAGNNGKVATLAEALGDAASVNDSNGDSQSDMLSKTLATQALFDDDQPMSTTGSDMPPPQDSGRKAATPVQADGRINATRAMGSADRKLSSSPGSQFSTGSHKPSQHPRHRESAMNLMKKSEAAKASPEVGTDVAIATGRVDVPLSGRGTPIHATPLDRSPSGRPRHGYAGGDPNVHRYLDVAYASHFPISAAEFGPRVQPLKGTQIPNATGQNVSRRWKPQGLLVAAIAEHTKAVTCMAVAPDHAFWLTGSTDGTVKVYDTQRLERNISHQSRQTHRHRETSAITALCFVDSTHSFISCAIDGSLNVVRVEYTTSSAGSKYGKLQVLRDWSMSDAFESHSSKTSEEAEYAVAIEHFRFEDKSLCLLLTSRSRMLALDLKNMDVIYSFDNPLPHGAPNTFCVHRRRQWLLIGTSHGVLDLWDLRFRLRLRSWTFKSPHPIRKLSMHPGRRNSHRMRVCIAGGTGVNHISVWDIEKLFCCEVYIVAAGNAPKLSQRDVELIPLSDDSEDGLTQLDRFVAAPDFTTQSSRASSFDANPSSNRDAGKQNIPGAVQDFVMQMHAPPDTAGAAVEARHAFLLTAGPEWKTRFWDPENLKDSAVVNSGAIEPFTTASAEESMTVSASILGADTRIYTDSAPDSILELNADAAARSSGQSTPAASPAKRRAAERSVSSAGTIKGEGRGEGHKQTRYGLIRNSAHHLLTGHRDEITCMALLERPFGMVITGDRSGLVYVFQ